jgi:predicted transcriptional regulator
MTAKEFSAARERLGYQQKQLADLLGRGERTVRRYEVGESPVPAGVAKLIHLALNGKINLAKLEAVT